MTIMEERLPPEYWNTKMKTLHKKMEEKQKRVIILIDRIGDSHSLDTGAEPVLPTTL